MYPVTLWQRLLGWITRAPRPGHLLIRPQPSGCAPGRYHLAAYDIPASENFGDC